MLFHINIHDRTANCVDALFECLNIIQHHAGQAPEVFVSLAGNEIIPPLSVLVFAAVVDITRRQWEARTSFQPPPETSGVSGWFAPGAYYAWLLNAIALVCESGMISTSDEVFSLRFASMILVISYAAAAGVALLYGVAHPSQYTQPKFDAADRVTMIGWIVDAHYLLQRLVCKLKTLPAGVEPVELEGVPVNGLASPSPLSSAASSINHGEDLFDAPDAIHSFTDTEHAAGHQVPLLFTPLLSHSQSLRSLRFRQTIRFWTPSLQTATWLALELFLTIAMLAYNIQHGNLLSRLLLCGVPFLTFIAAPLSAIYYWRYERWATHSIVIGTLTISIIYLFTPRRWRYDPDSPTAPRSAANLSDWDQATQLAVGCLCFIIPLLLRLTKRGKDFQSRVSMWVCGLGRQLKGKMLQGRERRTRHVGGDLAVDTSYHGAQGGASGGGGAEDTDRLLGGGEF
ncbi:uncharacterized protein N0V89_009316 [Didymosphaeria variabile]|uniref:Uncharacterized protein n=1 Tax=Didymosphaeria variabile TaxID=1932322 RepID=A0A9W8XE44_9PLEO|nr:uncharacterized protein N0V89_009316 [Didymosphaeria variabile]KAJ4347944.1 hypothetical protein N0V89_009316 [Didymosphaeria variabile]